MRSIRVRAMGIVAIVACLVPLAACGGDDGTADAPAASTSEAPATEPPATEPTDAPDTAPGATAVQTSEAPITEPATTEPPSTEPAEGPVHSDPATGTFEIVANVVDGQPEGGLRTYLVEVGTPVTITVTSDVADEAHLHGYDIEADLEPGVPATISFTADMTGSFECETHESGAQLFIIDVV